MAITAGLSGAGRLAAFRVGKNPLANCAKNQYNRIVSLNISMNEVLLMPLWKRTLAALLLAVMMILPFASAEDAGEAVPDDSVEWTEGAANITRDLTLNDEGDDVSALQTALTDLCYYSGDVTGRYGEATKTAVEDFQRDFAPCGDGHGGQSDAGSHLRGGISPAAAGMRGRGRAADADSPDGAGLLHGQDFRTLSARDTGSHPPVPDGECPADYGRSGCADAGTPVQRRCHQPGFVRRGDAHPFAHARNAPLG